MCSILLWFLSEILELFENYETGPNFIHHPIGVKDLSQNY